VTNETTFGLVDMKMGYNILSFRPLLKSLDNVQI